MEKLRFLTSGESHGPALLAILEGLPAGLAISEEFIAIQLKRRQQGYGRGGRMKIEQDFAKILSGVRHGFTLGSPIGLQIQNKDFENWREQMANHPIDEQVKRVTKLRPGHADQPGIFKYGHSDVRNILERASARETAARVAAGAIAQRFLEEFGINLKSHVLSIGTITSTTAKNVDWEYVENSPVRCADPEAEQKMIQLIDKTKKDGDTAGGIFEVIANGVPVGLGSHIQWDKKLDAQIAQIMMSINAVKGVQIGDGFGNSRLPGSKVHDVIEFYPNDLLPFQHSTNRHGGIEGGMSTGQPLVIQVAIKPISTLSKPLPSVNMDTGEKVEAHYERSDVCQVPPACVIGEACLALVIADAILEKFGGDNLKETLNNYHNFQDNLKQFPLNPK